MNNEYYIFLTSQNLESLRADIPVKNEDVVMNLKGEYSIFIPEKGVFECSEENAQITIVRDNENGIQKCFLKIKSNEELLHEEEIDGSSTFRTQKNNKFVWNVKYKDSFYTFSLQFKNRIDFLEFVSKYTTNTNKMENPEDTNVEFYEDREHELEDDMNHEDDYTGIFESSEEDEKNNFLCIERDKAFVSRGTSIGVFNVDNEINFLSHIKNLNYGHNIVPEKMISDNNSSIFMLDKNDSNSIYKLDLDRGKVVESYEFDDKIQDFFEAEKFKSGSLVSVSENALYKLDPRINKVVSENVYKTNNKFRCGMSTESGKLAVASANGSLRLYDNLEKRAKMLLPGYGDEILGVDRSGDGRFVICTCKSYILFYDMNVEGKPKPTKLYVKPEHIAYMKESIIFTPAVFSTDGNDSILVGTGHYAITWYLSDVLSGLLFNYHIKKYSDYVVGERFKDNNIIVALKDDVKMTGLINMKNPEKIVKERRDRRK